jgi:hypothetical protein
VAGRGGQDICPNWRHKTVGFRPWGEGVTTENVMSRPPYLRVRWDSGPRLSALRMLACWGCRTETDTAAVQGGWIPE